MQLIRGGRGSGKTRICRSDARFVVSVTEMESHLDRLLAKDEQARNLAQSYLRQIHSVVMEILCPMALRDEDRVEPVEGNS